MARPGTVGELKQSGYRPRSVKEELRQNLIRKLERGEQLFSGIVGYDESVVPQIENAVLSGQDIVFLGERGQAKTRLARSLVSLLDDEVAVMKDCEINDDPLEPICQACRDTVAELDDRSPIEWLPRDRRYGEKLATPDITIADLIGEVDPIKVAEGRYLADELTIHYGLLPRTNRGIFTINELPDLAERIQVGLLNIMEERDVQIRGYKVRLPLDLYVVASANPEDYTNRGRIITPLKDRFGSQIRTHYPKTTEHEIAIIEQERTQFAADGYETAVPEFMAAIVAELTHLARRSSEISQRSGVSVRVSICNFENLLSNALKRAIRLREQQVAPRVSDLQALVASTAGKIELESVGDADEQRVVDKLIQRSILNVFNRHFQATGFDELIRGFEREVRRTGKLKQYELLHSVARRLPFGLRRHLFRPLHTRFGGRFRFFVVGGAALDPELGLRWEDMGFKVLQGYGTTEAAPAVAITHLEDRALGTVGWPVEALELRIAPDDEILIKGPAISPGYWENPTATAESFRDGWYHTGDLGEIDAQGRLRIKGRKKSMIVLANGQNVYPEDVEAALRPSPAVKDAVVLGLRRGRADVDVHAVLVMHEPDQADAAVRAANRRLAAHQQIRGHTLWPDEDFPRTLTLKARRPLISERLKMMGVGETA